MDRIVGKNRLRVDGKFFSIDGLRVWLRCVTYGPFPQPLPVHDTELKRIKAAGFHAIRIYEAPTAELLEAAKTHDLLLFVGIPWQWYRVFLGGADETYWHEGRIDFLQGLREWGSHPNVAAIYIANELPVDVVRWMGADKVRAALDALIIDLRGEFPHLLYAYSSFPTTEFLEPMEADFTAFNIYLENPENFRSYLDHLHHVAGDRPLLISETGLDSYRNGVKKQAEILKWIVEIAHHAGTAGVTLFSWSDLWQNGDKVVTDWDFGLTDREGNAKPALENLLNESKTEKSYLPALIDSPLISVIICVHNGVDRVQEFLGYCDSFDYSNYEVIIVDDGSKDDLEELC
ncbi:glycosyltransferase, partial [Akkermansiaceae bacterium]|nr:glycosyltransferase [Akkermansiaceae bacterium]